MVDYVQTFVVEGRRYGIEDHEAPGAHFFPHKYASGERKRFTCWVGGSGIGQYDTLEEARLAMGNHIRREYREKVEAARDQVTRGLAILDRLTTHGLDGLLEEKSDVTP